MNDRELQLVDAWIDAYYTGRDEDLVALAHPEVVIRPRAGLGERLYEGVDGLRRWLADTGATRSPIDEFTTAMLPDGRVIAEADLEGTPVVALFEIRDDRIASVKMYISDRELLERLGKIDAGVTATTRRRVGQPGAEAQASAG